MRGEKLYQDCATTLQTLARLLSVRPYQLSQILNERYQIKFKDYLNTHRIEHAKHMLLECHDQSVLSICYNSGFNSKANFNAIFKKFTGMTPQEYRNTMQAYKTIL
jgi:YesN/AraC family two-component response regulator